MTEKNSGMGAEVGVRKINDDGDVTETRGTASPPRWAFVLFWTMVVLSLFGVWKLVDLLLILV